MNVFRRLFNTSDTDNQPLTPEPTPDPSVEDADDDRALIVLNGATRPLLAEEEPPALDLRHLMFGQHSDIGMVRKNNQDAIDSFYAISESVDNRPGFGIFIVADGMGGHHDGEIASSIAARTVMNELIRSLFLPMLANGDDERPPIAEAIEASIIRANNEVVHSVPDGGTTLTVAVIQDDLVCIGHVGDSRAYLIRGREAKQLTRDHSYVQRLAELGQIDAADASSHLIKNVLYRALGQTEQLDVDVLTQRLPAQSYLLLCSDGLWGQVKEYEIISTVVNNPNPQAACRELVARANASGGVDNVSAILIQVPG